MSVLLSWSIHSPNPCHLVTVLLKISYSLFFTMVVVLNSPALISFFLILPNPVYPNAVLLFSVIFFLAGTQFLPLLCLFHDPCALYVFAHLFTLPPHRQFLLFYLSKFYLPLRLQLSAAYSQDTYPDSFILKHGVSPLVYDKDHTALHIDVLLPGVNGC